MRPRTGRWTIDHELDQAFRAVGDRPAQVPRRIAIGAQLSASAFMLGLWLVVSPFALGYGVVGNWFTGHSNEVMTGAVVVIVAMIGAMAPADTRWAGPVMTAAGAWLAAAPWTIGYRERVDPTAATINDVVVGCSIAVLGLTVAVVTRRRKTESVHTGSAGW